MCTWLPSRSSRAGRRGRSSFDCLCCCLVLISHRPWFRLFSPVLTRSTHPSIGMACKIYGSGEIKAGADPKGGRGGAEYETGWAMGDRLVRALSLSLPLSAPASSKVFHTLLWIYCSSAPEIPKGGATRMAKMINYCMMIEMKTSSSEQIQASCMCSLIAFLMPYAWPGGDIHTNWHL